MKWIRYDIKTKTDASDIITAELYDLGITSVEVTDNILPEEKHWVDMLWTFSLRIT